MRTIEVNSTSLEKAIEKGLMLLETELDKVEYKVLEENATLKKFKIEMTIFDNDDERKEYLESKPKKVEKKEHKERPEKELPYDAELSQKVLEDVREYLDGFLKVYGSEYNLSVTEENKDITAVITGENMGGLIGYHGDALDALQSLINSYIREKYDDYGRKIYLDIENYRAKRENTIIDMALRLADKVVKNKRSMKLEPMTRYERKVIHNALQNKEHIDTHSEGTDPDRFLIIDYID